MSNIVAGIKEDELSNLSVEILNYADRVSEIFDKLDTCVERLPVCYKGTPCQESMQRYQELATSYAPIRNNIISYSDDLTMLVQKMHDSDVELGTLFQEYADDKIHKIKQVNEP